jgi:hypothetical protein
LLSNFCVQYPGAAGACGEQATGSQSNGTGAVEREV